MTAISIDEPLMRGAKDAGESIPNFENLLAELDREINEECDQQAAAKGIPVAELEAPESADELLASIERLESMTVSKLRSEYEQLGFVAPDDMMSRAELMPLVKDALIWERLKLSALQQVCRQHSIKVEQTRPRSEMMLLLAEPTWNNIGIPLRRFEGLSVARSVLNKFRALDKSNFADLMTLCLKHRLPTERKAKKDVVAQLKKVAIWEALTLPELQKECQTSGIDIDEESGAGNANTRHQELFKRLVLHSWGSKWMRLQSFETMDKLIQQVSDLRGMSNVSLRSEYRKLGVPFDESMEDQALVDRLADVLIWQHCPLEQLRSVCHEAYAQLGNTEIALLPKMDDVSERQELIRLLVLCSWESTWASRGIPAHRLPSLETVETVLLEIDRLQTIRGSSLQAEYKEMGVPFDSQMGSQALVDRLKEVVIWRNLPLAELRKECVERGALHAENAADDFCFENEDAERDELIKQLIFVAWTTTWQKRGIPAKRLGSLETVEMLIDEVDCLQSMSSPALLMEYRKVGMPFDAQMSITALVDRMRQVLVWQHLPLEELRKDCALHEASAAGEFADEPAEREELIRRLVLSAWHDTWRTRGIPAERLGSLEVIDALIKQVDNLQEMTTLSLKAAYRKMGTFFDARMSDQALVNRMRDLAIWQSLPINELQEECRTYGVPVIEPDGESCVEARRQMKQHLLEESCIREWEARGIPARRLGNFHTCATLVEQFESIEKMSTTELKVWYNSAGFPEERYLERSEVVKLLRAVTVWEALPVDELKKECKQLNVGIEDLNEAGSEEDIYRHQLLDRLSAQRRLAVWESKGFDGQRLGSQQACIQVIAQYESIEQMSLSSLREWYKKSGFPEERNIDKNELVKLLKKVTYLQALPLAELQKEWGTGENAKEAATLCEDPSEQHDQHQQLVTKLMLRERVQAWEAQKGIPLHRIGDEAAIFQVISQYEKIDHMSMTELADWYKKAGFPEESDTTRSELAKLFKKVTFWHGLPLSELRLECEQSELPLDEVSQDGEEEEQRQKLVDKLFFHDRSLAWDTKGYHAKRINNMEKVIELVAQYEYFQSLSMDDLKKACAEGGLPVEVDLKRHDLLKNLKTVLVWEMLPLPELQKECAERKLMLPDEESSSNFDDKQSELVQRLKLSMSISMGRSTYEKKGVPVGRLGVLQAAHVATQYESFESMGIEQLRLAHEELNLPLAHTMPKNLLLSRVKDVTLWSMLSVPELMSECQERGLVMAGTSLRDIGEGDDEQRESLLDMLMLNCCERTFEEMGVPARKLNSFKHASGVKQAWDSLETGSDMGALYQRYEDVAAWLGLPCEKEMPREELVKILKDVMLWQLLPLDELQKLCGQKSFPWKDLDTSKCSEDEQRQHLLRKLVVHERSTGWEKMGFQLHKMGSIDAIVQAVAQLEDFMQKSDEGLEQIYMDAGLPKQVGLPRSELLKRMQAVLTWELIPMSELQKECKDHGLPVPSDGDGGREESIRWLVLSSWGDSWRSHGIPAERLGRVEVAEMLTEQVENLKTAVIYGDMMGTSKRILKAEFDKFRMPFEGHLDNNALIERLKNVLVWQHLPIEELRKDCAVYGAFPECDAASKPRFKDETAEREESINRLVLATGTRWKTRGIPASQLGSVELANKVAEQVDRLHSLVMYNEMIGNGPAALQAEYRTLGLPFDPKINTQGLIERLKNVSVWQHLPIQELKRLCRSNGLTILAQPDQGTERKESIKKLVLLLWTDTWKERGIPAERFDSLEIAEKVMKEVDKIETMEPLALKQRIGTCFGQAPRSHLPLARKEMAELLRDKLIWDNIPMSELRHDCRKRGVATNELTLKGTSAAELRNKMTGHLLEHSAEIRAKMIGHLMEHAALTKWEARGIPVRKLSDFKGAVQLVETFERIEVMNTSELTKWYKDLGLPKQKDMDRNAMMSLAKRVETWVAMPVASLRKEAEKGDLQVSKVSESASEEQQKEELIDMFLKKHLMETWDEKYQTLRVGNADEAMEMIRLFEHYEQMSAKEIMTWYTEMGFPEQQNLQQSDLLQLAKSISKWKVLPLDELLKECESHGIRISPEDEGADADDRRSQLLDQLVFEDRMKAWEEQGFKSRLFDDVEQVKEVVSQFEYFQNLDLEELRKTYSKAGLPNSETTDRGDILKTLKKVLIWELLPMPSLLKECKANQVPTEIDGTPSNEERQQELVCRLKVDLTVSMTSSMYESKKIPVDRLGTLQAHRVMEQLQVFEAMGMEELKKTYTETGLPQDNVVEREQFLDGLKLYMVWEALPLQDLKKECVACKLPVQLSSLANKSEDDIRGDLIQKLAISMRVTMCRATFERKGVPVDRLDPLEAAEIADKFDGFEKMGVQQLRRENEGFGMPVVPSLTKQALLSRVRDATLWEALSVDELKAECETRNLSMKELPTYGEEAQREFMLDQLLFNLCESTFDELDIPTWQLNKSFSAASKVVREWDRLDTMSDAACLELYSQWGVSSQFLELRVLRQRLKDIEVWKVVPSKDLEQKCMLHQVPVGASSLRGDARNSLIRRLVARLWPPRPDPKPPPPKMPQQGRIPAWYSKLAPHFKVLELPVGSSFEDVKKAYRKLALKYHPDKNVGANQEQVAREFLKVAEAYEKLNEHFNPSTKKA